jgi:IS30 family transposase
MPGERLSLVERREMWALRRQGYSFRAIGDALNRSASTVCREFHRVPDGQRYSYLAAHKDAVERARRPKDYKLEGNGPLARAIAARLKLKWSPEQIANRLRRDHPDDPRWHVSAETIYASLFVDARGGLADELRSELRAGQPRRGTARNHRGQIVDKTMISDRPREVRGRQVPGHWEGDLILPKDGRSAVATLIERSTRFTLLVALPNGRSSQAVKDCLAQAVQQLPAHVFRSLTWDQGKEMAAHAQFTIDTGIQVYFCEPRKPWQRGTNENTNGLIRQYYPKTTDFSGISQADLDQTAFELNGRPRKVLGWDTPAERFDQVLQNPTVATAT